MTFKIVTAFAILGAGAYLRWGIGPVGVAYELGKTVERCKHAEWCA